MVRLLVKYIKSIFETGNMLTKGLMIFLLLNLKNISGSGQIRWLPNNIQSPNVSTLGLFTEVPVSYFTGTPTINIPLYTLKEREIGMPVSLNYHASGVRVDMHPGWAGLNWNLEFGGAIYRTVNGIMDEYDNDRVLQGGKAGYYFNANSLNRSDWNQIPFMQTVARQDVKKDTEPDEFNFSFGNYQGKFYWSHEGKWKVKCDKPIKVIFDNTFLNVPFTSPYIQDQGQRTSFSGFTIITEDGSKYVFGNDVNAIEYGISFFNQERDNWTANAWFLTKIIGPNGSEISLSYERGDFVNQMYLAPGYNLGSKTDYGHSGNPFAVYSECHSSSWSNVVDNYYSGVLVSPVYVKEIKSSHAVVKFQSSLSNELRYDELVYRHSFYAFQDAGGWGGRNGWFLYFLEKQNYLYPQCMEKLQWRKLDKIVIENNSQQPIKSFELTYNNKNDERLFLLSVKEIGTNGIAKPPYLFEYDTSVLLPKYLSNRVDHWGFYNGKYARIDDAEAYYNYREPDAQFLYAGTLNKITYPTGGYSKFSYEPHYYSKRLNINRSDGVDLNFNSNTLAGGLRIKEIENFNANSAEKKSFFYVKKYENNNDTGSLMSSGVLGGQAQYYFKDYRVHSFNEKDYTYSQSQFASISVLPACLNSSGSHIGYTEVIEKQEGNGYKKYEFSNFDNGHNDEPTTVLQISRTPYEPHISLEEERGKLIRETSFNSSNSIISRKEIEYIPLNKNTEFVRSLKASWNNLCPGSAAKYEEGTAYGYYTYSLLPSKETETIYSKDGSVGLFNTTDYQYNNNRQATNVTTRLSKGEVITQKLSYPSDFAAVPIYSDMEKKNMIGPVIEKNTSLKTDEIEKVLTKEKTTYDYWNNKTIIAISSTEKSWSGKDLEKQISCESYDKFGNLQQFKSKDGVTTSIIWGYGSQYPIAKITGIDYTTAAAQINTAIINAPSNDQTLRDELGKLRTLPGALVTTYTYSPLIGMTSETDANGNTTYYEYDGLGRLSYIKDKDKNIIKKIYYDFAGQKENSGFCSNCTCAGQQWIKGVCETGGKVYTNSLYIGDAHGNYYSCTYHYLWSDGSVSADFHEHSSSPCKLSGTVIEN